MFQSLRANQQVFVLHKENIPYFEVATVVNVGGVRVIQPTQMNAMPTYVVDVTVRSGDRTDVYPLPPNSTYATAQNGQVSIAISRDDIEGEVDKMYQGSSEAINPDTLEYHKNVVSACKCIKQQLHPELAEKERQEQRVQSLENQMSQMSQNIADLMAMNKALLEQLTQGEKTNGNKQKNQ